MKLVTAAMVMPKVARNLLSTAWPICICASGTDTCTMPLTVEVRMLTCEARVSFMVHISP